MKVLKGKTSILAVIIVAALIIIMIIGIAGVRSLGNHDADQQLLVLCETGQKNLDTYFENVEQSVEMVSAYIESDLENTDSDQLSDHLDQVRDIFAKMADETEGAYTYYYRIDPEVSTEDIGFWYTNLDGKGFVEHEPTDITQYDTNDTSQLVWFTVPKATGEGIWLPPYITDNLDKRVISYNAPVYQGDKFIGVIGIEIDYKVMAEQVDNITLYEHGYAFINDAEGVIIYHPHIDVKELTENMPKAPAGLLSDNTFVTYTFEGVKKRAVWLPLSNGMRLNVTAPVSEINAGWHKWAILIIIISFVLLIFIIFLFRYLQRVIHKNRETEDENARLEKELESASELTELMGTVSSLMMNMPAMTFTKDAATGAYIACNQYFADYARKDNPKDVVGLTDHDLFDLETADHFVETDQTALSMDEAYIYLEDVRDPATSVMQSLQTTKKKYTDTNGKLCVLGVCVDVTESTKAKAEEVATQVRKQEEEKKKELEATYKKDVKRLHHKASHDEMTGLYNRLGYDQIIEEIDLSTTHLLMFDADKFKTINDTYGHDVGDRILIKIANTLKKYFRTDDYICRMGGDEFVVFMVHSWEEHRQLIASKIDMINRDLENIEDGLPAITVSVGIAHDSETSDPAALLELADQAMYEAKQSDTCRYCFSEKSSADRINQSDINPTKPPFTDEEKPEMEAAEKFRFDQRTQEILEHLTIPFAIYQYVDKRVVTIALSQGFCDEFGFQELEDAYVAMDNDMYRATHPDDKTRVADAAYRFAAFDIPYDIVYRTRTLKDSDYIILHAYGKSIYPKPGVRLCLTWYAFEGHYSPDQGTYESVLNQTLSRFLTEESQYHGTYYDNMTGLPNMAYFYELAEAGCRKMKEQNTDSAILFFNLTGLKHFNQQHGFAEGDHLICAVASILAKHFSNENCARFAQDHFAAFAPEEGLTELLDAVIAECAAANDGKSLPLRIGVYPNRIEAVEIGTACDRARLAANVQKNLTESHYSFFDMDMMTEEKNRQAIIDNIDKAVSEGWIQAYYQPIIRSTNGKVCNLEALARWNDPGRGLLMPYSFIPVLEESMLIHKLDMCVVKQVLSDLKDNDRNNVQSVPVSINFSRADFDAIDLVQEICTLVDEAEVDRRLINIEITESIVGSDFDYMKEQIERFRAQGFQVWMDDFGSGYSSLDVLQSVKFDLIKFDMGFMRRLDEGDDGKIILTEMMKMATSLGVDTICEGVETEEQVHFLQEIGCSKLQGYYFMKPVPNEQILEKYLREMQDGFEDPRESAYYDTMGRVNLYDLSFLANLDDSVTKNTFDTVPMGIMEVSREGDKMKYVRTNESFRDFIKRAFNFDLSDPDVEYTVPKEGLASGTMNIVEKCRNNANRAFVDEKMEDGSIVHSFVRWIGTNPVNKNELLAVAVLSITEPDESTTFADIARSLAADYYNVYVIDLDTDDFIEYSSQVGEEKLVVKRRGEGFFESARRDTMTRIYEEDREPFLQVFSKENVIRELDAQGVFTTTYRLIDTGEPMYVNMKITRMQGANRIIMGISIIDAQMKQKEHYEELKKEREMLVRVMALSEGYLVLYTVDLKTETFVEYSSSDDFDSLGALAEGEDFFRQAYDDAEIYCYAEDRKRFQQQFTKENVFHEIQKSGSFKIDYHLMIRDVPRPVTLKAALFKDGNEEKLVVGVREWQERQRSKEPEKNQ